MPGPSQRFDYAGRIPEAQGATFLAFAEMLHTEPAASAFARLLGKRLSEDDYVHLAHLFEEISVLVLHNLIAEELVFDAFAVDMYWDELREDVLRLRETTGNDKLCENFEIAAGRARAYREERPPKLRWQRRRPPGDDPPDDWPDRGPARPPEPDPAPGGVPETVEER